MSWEVEPHFYRDVVLTVTPETESRPKAWEYPDARPVLHIMCVTVKTRSRTSRFLKRSSVFGTYGSPSHSVEQTVNRFWSFSLSTGPGTFYSSHPLHRGHSRLGRGRPCETVPSLGLVRGSWRPVFLDVLVSTDTPRSTLVFTDIVPRFHRHPYDDLERTSTFPSRES